jgi:hypothetical protein
LERAPRGRWDPEAFKGSLAERAIEAAEADDGWSAVLPRLRDEAKLKRATVVERLAEALGFADQRDRVAAYYHQMEQGRLPSDGVSARGLEALASILGTTAGALRKSGEAAPSPRQAGGEVFARGGAPDAMASPASPGDGDDRSRLAVPDELDRLFIGGE